MINMIKMNKDTDFTKSYNDELLGVCLSVEVESFFKRINSSFLGLVANSLTESNVESKYRVTKLLPAGSVSRGTFYKIPVDFDYIVVIESAWQDVDYSDLRQFALDLAGFLCNSSDYKDYCTYLGIPQAPNSGKVGIEDPKHFGISSILINLSIQDTRSDSCRSIPFIDITFQNVQHSIDYEIYIQKYFKQLRASLRQRLLLEIRLAKKIFEQLGLYGLDKHGFPGHVVEQLVIQSNNYRTSGLAIGTLDNFLCLLDENTNTKSLGDPESSYQSYLSFRDQYPVWHLGYQSKSANGYAPNMLEFLEEGGKIVCAKHFAKLIALGKVYKHYFNIKTRWTIDSLVNNALHACSWCL